MEIRAAGARGQLVEVTDPAAALALATWARQRVKAEEIVPAARTVLFDGLADPDALAAELEDWSPGAQPPSGETVEIPVDYDGADLDDVARLWGTDADEVVRTHQATDFVSTFCGFAPGFAYLSGLSGAPNSRAVPRLDTPRSRVPAGSVALADEWCAVYPTPSPGGWWLIGHTDAVLWDPAREQPAVLPPGTHVRFVAR